MNIGERIKARRLERGMTLEEVAKVVKVTRGTIQKYENSLIGTIPYDKVVLLSKALMVSPAYLMGWDDEKKQPPESEELSQAQKDLISLVSRLPEDVCAAMLIALRQQFPPDDPDSR